MNSLFNDKSYRENTPNSKLYKISNHSVLISTIKHVQ